MTQREPAVARPSETRHSARKKARISYKLESESDDEDYAVADLSSLASDEEDGDLESATLTVQPAPLFKDRRRRASKAAEKNNTKKKGVRNAGKLKMLLEMPADILFEVTSHLKPIDILQLSRVSKGWRESVMRNGAKHMWVAARRNISGLPDCPNDMTEPDFAKLLFENRCHSCDCGRAKKLDYALRVRYCGPCWKGFIKRGKTILRGKEFKSLRLQGSEIYTLVPASAFGCGPGYGTTDHFEYNEYNVEELETVARNYMRLSKQGDKSFSDFVAQRKRHTEEIVDHTQQLLKWDEDRYVERREEGNSAESARKDAILARLDGMGYSNEDFPSSWQHEWYSIMNQPRELTDRIWKIIEPKLVRLIAEEKERRIQDAEVARLKVRREDFETLYHKLHPDGIMHVRGEEACGVPSIHAMIVAPDDDRITEERWNAIEDIATAEIAQFIHNVMREIVGLISITDDSTKEVITGIDGNSNLDVYDWHFKSEQHFSFKPIDKAHTPELHLTPEYEILQRASSVVQCRRCDRYISAVEAISHISDCATSISNYFHSARKQYYFLKNIPRSTDICHALLKRLGHTEDTPAQKIDYVNEVYKCNCGNPDYKRPMTFAQIIAHVSKELLSYAETAKDLRFTKPEIVPKEHQVPFINDHDISQGMPYVELVDGESVSSPDPPVDPMPPLQVHGFCKACVGLSPTSLKHISCLEHLAYHMRGKHGTTTNGKADILDHPEAMAFRRLLQENADRLCPEEAKTFRNQYLPSFPPPFW